MTVRGERIIVGMSGGVDSSVTAWLLREQGYDVHGLFMFNWDEDEQGYCTAAQDFQDARRVCRELEIPLHRVNFAAQYRERVFDEFLAGLERGVTPNPDVLCNREIKFGEFLNYAQRLGARQIATGHYARVVPAGDTVQLYKGVDPRKDQSYFLHAVPAAALEHSVFPLGELTKAEVRELAQRASLHVSRKRDSTGICFVGERPFREFLEQYLPNEPGPACTPEGLEVGEHAGLAFYTLGQRQGLGIGGVAGAAASPWYVVGKDPQSNTLLVAQGHDHPLLYSRRLEAHEMHWINDAPAAPFDCEVATRYRQVPAPAHLEPSADGTRCTVTFDEPQWAVTPGQYAVVYVGERCLGGGTIALTAEARTPLRATPV